MSQRVCSVPPWGWDLPPVSPCLLNPCAQQTCPWKSRFLPGPRSRMNAVERGWHLSPPRKDVQRAVGPGGSRWPLADDGGGEDSRWRRGAGLGMCGAWRGWRVWEDGARQYRHLWKGVVPSLSTPSALLPSPLPSPAFHTPATHGAAPSKDGNVVLYQETWAFLKLRSVRGAWFRLT